MSTNRLTNVAIVGVAGHIGSHIVSALQSTGHHTITAITRPESKGTLPEGIKSIRVDYSDEPSLVSALKGQQILIITLSVRAPPDLHGAIVNAASKAGVPYIMPNIWGGDIRNTGMLSETQYGQAVLARVAEVEKSNASYIAMCCGFWYEWSLALGEQWFGFDIKNKKVVFYDDGMTKINTSTWLQCGRAMGALLSLPEHTDGTGYAVEDWKDKPLYISSWRINQRDMLDSIHRVTGGTDADWNISYEPTEKRYKDGLEEFKAGDFRGFAKSLYARAFYPNGHGDFESVRGLDNEKLGLPKEDLDEATVRALEMVKSGWSPF